MLKLKMTRFVFLVLLASLAACETTPPSAPISAPMPVPTAVFVPEPKPIVAAPQPVYVAPEPDYTRLDGHSSYTTPVPVEPVDVQDMGPVIGE